MLYSDFASNFKLNIKRASVQQQNGYRDCGLFSIAYAVEVCLGQKPEDALFFQEEMRMHLCDCLSERQMRPFPRIIQDQVSIPRPKAGILTVQLFCVCKLPAQYDSDMVDCDICHQWFHCSCVHIDPAVPPKYWECPECS